jgi:hypothetical protein
MLTFEQAQDFLTEIADAVPGAIYRGLNGGIILLPDTKLHPENVGGDLYILGEYHYDPMGFGRYIAVYYGSFVRSCGAMADDAQKTKLREILYHELTHHLEHLAGDKSLELRDADDIAAYLRGENADI